MNHSEATAMGAVEKYVLGDLSADQRDTFEAHYFECAECAAELQALYTVKETIRLQPPTPESSTSMLPAWLSWVDRPITARIAVCACAALIGVAFLESSELRKAHQEAARPVIQTILQPGVMRGAVQAEQHFSIPLQLTDGYESFIAEVQSKDGTVLFKEAISSNQRANSPSISLKKGGPFQGELQLVVYALNSGFKPQEIDRKPIMIP